MRRKENSKFEIRNQKFTGSSAIVLLAHHESLLLEIESLEEGILYPRCEYLRPKNASAKRQNVAYEIKFRFPCEGGGSSWSSRRQRCEVGQRKQQAPEGKGASVAGLAISTAPHEPAFRECSRSSGVEQERQRERDAWQPSRIILDIPPDHAAILVSRKPAALPWPEYLLKAIRGVKTDCREPKLDLATG